MTTPNPNTVEPGDFMRDAHAIVEADDFAQQCLWSNFAHDSERCIVKPPLRWTQIALGHWYEIGRIGKRPVCVTLTAATINGKRVVFWDATSEVVDFAMVKAWLTANAPAKARWCNAMNFHNADLR